MKITLNNEELRTVFAGINAFIEAIYRLGEMPAEEWPDDDSDGGLDIEPDDPTPPEDHGAEPETEERTIHIGIGANVHGDLPGEIRERLEETLKRRFAEVATEEVRRIVGDE